MFLVTGITGLTGRFLFAEIRRGGMKNSLRCLVRETSDLSWMGEDRPELVYGDVGQVEDLEGGLAGVEGLIHLVNIRYSPQVIEACRRARVRRVVFVNTTGIYSRYQAYSRLYLDLERQILSSGLDYTIIRPTMIYGNHQDKNIHKLVKLLRRLPVFPVVGSGKARMQPIYAGDLAKVVLSAYVEPNAIRKEYNVAGKYPLPYQELLQEIARALGVRRYFFHIPYSLALLAGRIGDVIPNGLVTYERIQRLAEDKNFDYSAAQDDLGFEPLPFVEGIRLEIEALRQAGLI